MSSSYCMAVLGLDPGNNPTLHECRKQARKLSKIFHPDRSERMKNTPVVKGSIYVFEADMKPEEKMIEINQVMEALESAEDMMEPDAEEMELRAKLQLKEALMKISDETPPELFTMEHVQRMLTESVRVLRCIPIYHSKTVVLPEDHPKDQPLDVTIECDFRCEVCVGRGVILPDVDTFDRCKTCYGTCVRPYYIILSRIEWVVSAFDKIDRMKEGKSFMTNKLLQYCANTFPFIDIDVIYKYYKDLSLGLPENVPLTDYIMDLGTCPSCVGTGLDIPNMEFVCRWCRGIGHMLRPLTFSIPFPERARDLYASSGIPYNHTFTETSPLAHHHASITIIIK